ncbi:MAG: hypothetical protein FWC85_01385 [Elusimicrobia bacterium]|nr:hypothetical protein [Elusimicrobiota bacterium]
MNKEQKISFSLKTNIILSIGCLILYIIFNINWFLFVAFLILLAAAISVKAAELISDLWMKFGRILAGVSNRIILGASYYFMLVPLAFFYRISNKNLAKYFFKTAPETYYKTRDVKYTKESLENPW